MRWQSLARRYTLNVVEKLFEQLDAFFACKLTARLLLFVARGG
jgi:hypothetical protein